MLNNELVVSFSSDLRNYLNSEQPSKEIKADQIKDLIQHAYDHRLIFHLPKMYFVSDNVVKKNLDRLTRRESIQHLLMSQHLFAIVSVLNHHQISCAVLKGIPLNRQLYGNQCMRMSKDIDLLVSKDDLRCVHQHLYNLGYTLNSILSPIDICNMDTKLKDLIYQHREKPIQVELHWITSMVSRWGIRLEQSPEYFEPFFLSEHCKISVLNKELNFIYLLMHAAIFHWKRMQLVVDIILFHKKNQLDWRAVIKIAQHMDATRCLYEAKIILNYFGVSTPEMRVTYLDKCAVFFHFRYVKYLWRDVTRWQPFVSQCMELLLIPRFSSKCRYLIDRIFSREICLRYLKLNPNYSRIKLFFMGLCFR